MILKGSQRGGGRNLADHLMNVADNEHVRLHELRDFAAEDLRGAFKEAEAISRGTKCRQFLFSLSLSPPKGASVSVEAFEAAIDRAEERLGLDGQPRAIVFHEKEGRRHAHCVWSRIDALTMTARPHPFFKERLSTLSRDLYREHGWTMPRGIAERGARDPPNFNLTEWQQAKRAGVDPRWLKADLQECWAQSDNARAFGQALQARGLSLARGDRRSFVVIDHDGEVHSLPRALGLKTKEVKERLGSEEALPGVADAKAALGAKMGAAMTRHIAASRDKFVPRAAALREKTAAMTERHRSARAALDERQRAEWQRETAERSARLPKGLASLWHRLTGQYRAVRAENEAEAARIFLRHRDERRSLIDAQLRQREALQGDIKDVRARQADQLRTLRREVGRYLQFSRSVERDAARDHGRSRDAALGLSLSRRQGERVMSNNNNNDNSLGIGIALVGAMICVMALLAYAVAVFAAIVLTVLCFFAWENDLTIGTWTLPSDEARAFVQRGVIGMCLVPVFVFFCEQLFGIRINPDYAIHLSLAGYTAGSLGIEMMKASEGEAEAPTITLSSAPPPAQIAPPKDFIPQRETPFRFASWDDEEELRGRSGRVD